MERVEGTGIFGSISSSEWNEPGLVEVFPGASGVNWDLWDYSRWLVRSTGNCGRVPSGEWSELGFVGVFPVAMCVVLRLCVGESGAVIDIIDGDE